MARHFFFPPIGEVASTAGGGRKLRARSRTCLGMRPGAPHAIEK
jgi:hypothetical protein